MILRKSVEYIRYLQQLVAAQAARNRDLETQLTRAGIAPGLSITTTTSALGADGAEAEMMLHDDAAFSLFGDHARRSLERVLEQHEDEMDIEGANAAVAVVAASMAGTDAGVKAAKLDEDHDLDSTGDSSSPSDDLGERGRARTRVKGEDDDDDMEVS